MPKGRRQDIYRHQAHAHADALGLCTGSIPHSRSYEAEWRAALCPLCLNWFSFEGMDEDHAPQSAGQSRLGPAQVVVMTCRDDNQRAGRTYEGEAAALRSMLTAVPSPACPVHQCERQTASGLLVVSDGAAFEATDVRAAYLVAFATLGHRWAMTSRLDRLRTHLVNGDLRYAARDYEILCAHDIPGLEQFHVYEIVDPIPAILVTGVHASVLLPCHLSPPDVRGRIAKDAGILRLGRETVRSVHLVAHRRKGWPWPREFVGPGGTPEKAWDDTATGNLFHYDRCLEEAHDEMHAVSRDDLLAAFNSAGGLSAAVMAGSWRRAASPAETAPITR